MQPAREEMMPDLDQLNDAQQDRAALQNHAYRIAEAIEALQQKIEEQEQPAAA
jgi:hypothetical protein